MRIEVVHLENIRSHVRTTVPFARGFNCLVGGLGCGKSSILYAIDFALFGDPLGRSYEYLLRDGAESGKVVLHFTQNGKSYTITRGLKRRGKGISQDFDELKLFEGETIIASVKSEAVAEQLKAITGLDKELFREIVWIRQEHLKELIDAPPRDRQRRLDELFGLSDYEIAWSNMAAYQKEYEAEKKVYEKDPDIVGLEKLNADYTQLAEEFTRLEIDIQSASRRLEEAKKTLEEADLRLKKLEELRASIEEYRRKEAQIQARLSSLEDSLAAIAEKIEGKKSIIENLKHRLTSMEAQIQSHKNMLKEVGVPADQPLEALRQYLLTFDSQIADLKAEQEAALRSMQADQRRLSSLSAENRCPLCLQPLTSEYKENLIQRIQKETSERQKTVNQLQKEIEELQQLKEKASIAITNLQGLMSRIDELKNRINEESKALAELSKEFEDKQKLEAELRAQLEKIRSEIVRFDVSEFENAKKHREKVFQNYYLLRSELQTMENRKGDLLKRLDDIKERIDQAQKKLEQMERLNRIIGVIASIRDAYRSIQPKLRGEFVKVLKNLAQQILDNLIGEEGSPINIVIDETYTPYVISESGVEREVSSLSGGERTLIAFAYRLGLGQLIMRSKTGHGLSFLLLDEPTESLGREDGSVDRLAEAISRFKAIEQIIAVTHSEAFAEKAEHVIRVEKEAGESTISVENKRN
ncbi:MAG: SMC family ATPase [Candidatus Bathyarchaeia archaeon]